MPERSSFAARGGWWVAAQMPILLLAFLLPPWTASSGGVLADVARYVGVLLLVLGGGSMAAGLLTLGPALTPFPHPRRNATLVTRGVYSLVRHPIYSGLIFAVFGWALAWLSPIGVIYAVLVALFFDRKAAREEVWLRARYPGYAAYAKRVRLFVPGIY